MAYSAENLATAKASGREYEYDTNYIYIERAEVIEYDLDDYDIDGAYTADDHGLEMFTGTTQAVYAVMIYGNNLKNKLEVDVLTISGQTLTSAQQGQARTNIGAASQADVTALNSNISVDTTQYAYELKTGFSLLNWGYVDFKQIGHLLIISVAGLRYNSTSLLNSVDAIEVTGIEAAGIAFGTGVVLNGTSLDPIYVAVADGSNMLKITGISAANANISLGLIMAIK